MIDGGWSPLNYVGDVTLVNNTAKTERFTLTGEEAIITAVGFMNGDDVARNVAVNLVTSANAHILYIGNYSGLAAADYAQYPHSKGATDEADHLRASHIPVANGNKIQFYFAAGGASTGGTGKIYVVGWKRRLPT